MKIQLNTDNNIKGSESLETFVSERLNQTLKHFTERITRLEVHLSDENAHKSGGEDIQCKIEARLQGKDPVTVASKSDTKEKAIALAGDKMKAALDTIVGKMKG